MKKSMLSVIVAVFLSICFVAPCFAGWLIFHKPEYRGRIIDAETKEPIEGVVIAVLYYVFPHISGPAGGDRRLIHAKETLTDKNGEFVIPSYTTLMSPNSFEWHPDFFIYKSGYASYPIYRPQIFPFQHYGPTLLFLKDNIGKQEEIKTDSEVVTVTFGVAELPRLKTREERIRAMGGLPYKWDKIPILLKAVNEESKRLGLDPVGPTREN